MDLIQFSVPINFVYVVGLVALIVLFFWVMSLYVGLKDSITYLEQQHKYDWKERCKLQEEIRATRNEIQKQVNDLVQKAVSRRVRNEVAASLASRGPGSIPVRRGPLRSMGVEGGGQSCHQTPTP